MKYLFLNRNKIKDDRSIPRLCRLTRASREAPYGFDYKTLKTKGRHVANNVRSGLPASKAGLISGDNILEVNGEQIDGMGHNQIVLKLSQHPNHVDLLVVADLQGYLIKQQQMRTEESFRF